MVVKLLSRVNVEALQQSHVELFQFRLTGEANELVSDLCHCKGTHQCLFVSQTLVDLVLLAFNFDRTITLDQV